MSNSRHNEREREARDTIIREIDGAIEALTELRGLVPASGADWIRAESESGSVLHHIGQLAQMLDVPKPQAAA